MTSDRGLVPRSPRRPRQWPAASRRARVPGRHSVGVRHRRPLERCTTAVLLAVYVLASPSQTDPLGRLPRRVGPVARQTAAKMRPRLADCDRRWLVLTGKKGGDEVGRCHRGHGTRLLLMTDANGTPLAAYTTAANHNEVNTIETLVDDRSPALPAPERLLHDKAADADWLREALRAHEIELICPHRENRTKPPTQDGRSLRRYKRRYRIERTISWLLNCRRLITRWEWYDDLFGGFVHLACLYTILQRL